MTHKKLKLIAVILLCFGITELYAQEAIPATCGDISGSDGSVCYSIGQIVYSTNVGTNGSVAEGIQQPWEISDIDGIEEAKDFSLNCTAYPNPTTDVLTLKVENYNISNLSYQIFDLNGKLIENKKITGIETSINMINCVSSIYFLKVFDNTKVLQSFKLIKN